MTLHRCALFCKSFDEDFGRLALLVASHRRWCPEMPFLLSIPRGQETALRDAVALHDGVSVVFDEDYTEPSWASDHGWAQQQVCKLSVHRTGFADAYLSVDSDAYLIAAVTPDDFFDGDRMRIVYSGLFSTYEASNPALMHYLLEPGFIAPVAARSGTLVGFGGRLNAFKRWVMENDVPPIERVGWINRLFNVPEETQMQPGQVLHAPLLRSMERYMATHRLDSAGLLGLVPWEYNWYGAFASVSAPRQVACGASPTVHFATDADIAHARAHGVTEAVLARRFKIVQMAARHLDAVAF